MKELMVSLFLIALMLSSCSPAALSTTPQPTGTASLEPAATNTSPPPTITPTTDPAPQEFPLAGCCLATPIDPGTYFLPGWMGLTFTVTVPPDWGVIRDDEIRVFAIARGENELGESSEFVQFNVIPATVTLADLQQDILDSPEFVFGNTEEVKVAGFGGFRVDAQATANPNEIGNRDEHIAPGVQHISVLEGILGGFWVTSTPEAMVRFTGLDVNGTVLFIFFEAENGQFSDFLEDADAMLASLALVQ